MLSAIIVCGGRGTRLNANKNKILLDLNGLPIYMHSLYTIKKLIDDVVIVANQDDYDIIKENYSNVVLGGKTRQESVYNGMLKVKGDKVLIHDGARPFLSLEDLKKVVDSTEECKASFLGNKVYSTLRNVNTCECINRDDYVLAATPQYVLKKDYLKAYSKAKEEQYTASDDIALITKYFDYKVKIIIGDDDNIKITTKKDYENAILKTKGLAFTTRIGHSWDCHRLVEGRKLILGGIEIPFEKGLLGHSDADALLHAIAESLLGALSLGDLGTHFPENDPKYSGIDSKILLSIVANMVNDYGYEIGNIDAMIYAEKPKMKPYINLMRESIAKVLNIKMQKISLKATTYEHMDAIGRGEAIASDSTVILFKK